LLARRVASKEQIDCLFQIAGLGEQYPEQYSLTGLVDG
jgi:hypothetical protein